MPYCSSDSKLAGYDELEAEITDESVDGSTLNFTIHLNRPCASCGTEAAEADLELSIEIEHECEAPDPLDEANWTRDDIKWKIDVPANVKLYDTRDEALTDAEGETDLLVAVWDEDQEPEYELQDSDCDPTDDMQRIDRHGKPIKNFRYAKRLLGASVSAHVHCERCDTDFDAEGSDNMPASSFEVMSH